LLEGHGESGDDDEIDENVDVGVAILDAGEGDHLVGLLVVGDEDDVADVDKEDEVACQHVDLFRIVECQDGHVEGHDDEAEHHLVDQNQIENEIQSIHLKAEHLETSVVVFSQFRLLLL